MHIGQWSRCDILNRWLKTITVTPLKGVSAMVVFFAIFLGVFSKSKVEVHQLRNTFSFQCLGTLILCLSLTNGVVVRTSTCHVARTRFIFSRVKLF